MRSSEPVLDIVNDSWEPGVERYMFFCPGCECSHWFVCKRPASGTGSTGPTWEWNRDAVKPTVTPSILTYTGENQRCHIYIKDGKIQFLTDCFHKLAGQTVDMEPG